MLNPFAETQVVVSNEAGNAGGGVVLLVEDDDDALALFKRAFDQAGLMNELRVARAGDEAMEYLKGEGKFANRRKYPFPALVLLDLNMPRVSGFEVLQWARSHEETRDLRIIVLTTSEDLGDLKRAYELGSNSFITKSHDTQEFVRQLRDLKTHWL
jgi:CheY-like chemotaxis protein